MLGAAQAVVFSTVFVPLGLARDQLLIVGWLRFFKAEWKKGVRKMGERQSRMVDCYSIAKLTVRLSTMPTAQCMMSFSSCIAVQPPPPVQSPGLRKVPCGGVGWAASALDSPEIDSKLYPLANPC